MTERGEDGATNNEPSSQPLAEAQPRWSPTVAAIPYYLRILTWFATPLTYAWLGSAVAGPILVIFLFLTVVADFMAGRTWWTPARPLPLSFMVLYLAACAGQWIYQGLFDPTLLLLMTLLMFSLGSDVIAVAMRGRFLVMTMLLAAIQTRIVIAHWPGLESLELFWPAGALGAISRVSWPSDTSGLMRTSLDFRPARLEIISWGMKKVIAVGLRRL